LTRYKIPIERNEARSFRLIAAYTENCDEEKASKERQYLYWSSWDSWNKKACF